MVSAHTYSRNKDAVCNFGGAGLFTLGRIRRGRLRLLTYLLVLHRNKKEAFVGIDEGCPKSSYIH